MKSKVVKILILAVVFSSLMAHVAFAGTASWKTAVETSYDLNFPGTILVYKDELNQGGLNLETNTTTTDKNEADIVFSTDPDIAARGVIDLGEVNFEAVADIPSSGYSAELKAVPGHTYLVLTHDDSFAKVLIQSVIGQKVFLKYSLLNSPANNLGQTNPANPGTDSTPNSGSNDEENTAIILTLGKQDALVNGTRKSMDVAPFTENGRTLVPLRFIGESLGAEVKWEAGSQTITLTLESTTIQLKLNSRIAYVNGKQVMLEVPAKSYKNRTMVPVRFVSESLGLDVSFDSKTAEIVITNQETTTTPGLEPSTPPTGSEDLSYFFHLFQLKVPGAVVEIPVDLDYSKYKATPGAMAGGIAIYSDGTYIWNSTWDGKVITGKWIKSGDQDYPITILAGEEGKDWKVGRADESTWGGGDIVIWDGSIWKNGTKVN